MSQQVTRRRIVLTGACATLWGASGTIISGAPGDITHVFATMDSTVDAAAAVGTTGATDIAVQVKNSDGRVLLEYELTSADPLLTFYSEEDMPVPYDDGVLTVSAMTDAGTAIQGGIIVVEVIFTAES